MKNSITLFLLLSFTILDAQIIVENPAVAEQTHQDLTIVRVAIYKDSTVIDLSVENKLAQGGWFCADKKIYIETPKDHKQYSITRARGIPRCPSAHSFKSVGEKLNFTLIFPELPTGIKLLNLIEDCDKSCFRFSGIILDDKLNDDIKLYNHGIELYAANKTDEAIDCFTNVVKVIPDFPTHVYGYSYFNLIRIYSGMGDKVTSQFWLNQLKQSTLPDKQYFIDALKKEGVIEK